jgi:hypothetical protein
LKGVEGRGHVAESREQRAERNMCHASKCGLTHCQDGTRHEVEAMGEAACVGRHWLGQAPKPGEAHVRIVRSRHVRTVKIQMHGRGASDLVWEISEMTMAALTFWGPLPWLSRLLGARRSMRQGLQHRG